MTSKSVSRLHYMEVTVDCSKHAGPPSQNSSLQMLCLTYHVERHSYHTNIHSYSQTVNIATLVLHFMVSSYVNWCLTLTLA